ncbi:MAG: glycosyl hydrolase family 17 protein [Myxococcota bacterium]
MRSEHEGICYSGYRAGQNPDTGDFPTVDQVAEDLRILSKRWAKIRIYDSGPHAELVLRAIEREGLDLEVLLGAYVRAEVNNPDCPWGAHYDDATLAKNVASNEEEIQRAIALAQRYPTLVGSVSAGNEATVDWSGNLIPVERMIHHVRTLKAAIAQPVTFCENHVPWMDKLAPLVPELDFISVHSYPVWEYRSIEEALAVTDADHERVQARYPGVKVAITEAGWTTRSNGRGIEPWNASPELQARYYAMLSEWARTKGVLTYVFEAFDEDWKGSDDPDEPEKHWGLFTIDRRPKPAMRAVYPELVA